jgi:hypothetical protein
MPPEQTGRTESYRTKRRAIAVSVVQPREEARRVDAGRGRRPGAVGRAPVSSAVATDYVDMVLDQIVA